MLRIVKGTKEATNVKPVEDDEVRPFDKSKAAPKKAVEIKVDIKPLKKLPEVEESAEVDPDESSDNAAEDDVEMVEPGKIDQQAVHYMEPGSKCGNCKHWLEPDGCELVSGFIKSDGICMLWVKGVDPKTDGLEDEPVDLPVEAEEA